jgi:aspartyl/asparaginyl-tRNA synthetase
MNQFNSFKAPAVIGLVCILVIAAVSCDVRTTRIGDIISHPRDFAGKEVTISGEVTESFSMVFIKYFMVRDDSGEIAVVTQRTLPAKGEKIKVKGSVKEAFSIGPETALVLVEKPGTM